MAEPTVQSNTDATVRPKRPSAPEEESFPAFPCPILFAIDRSSQRLEKGVSDEVRPVGLDGVHNILLGKAGVRCERKTSEQDLPFRVHPSLL